MLTLSLLLWVLRWFHSGGGDVEVFQQLLASKGLQILTGGIWCSCSWFVLNSRIHFGSFLFANKLWLFLHWSAARCYIQIYYMWYLTCISLYCLLLLKPVLSSLKSAVLKVTTGELPVPQCLQVSDLYPNSFYPMLVLLSSASCVSTLQDLYHSRPVFFYTTSLC